MIWSQPHSSESSLNCTIFRSYRKWSSVVMVNPLHTLASKMKHHPFPLPAAGPFGGAIGFCGV